MIQNFWLEKLLCKINLLKSDVEWQYNIDKDEYKSRLIDKIV